MVSLHFCENLDKIAKSDTRGATLARAAGSLWLAGPRQLARAHRLPLVTHPAARSAGLSAGGGNAAHSRCGPVWRATNPALDATAVV